MRLFDNAAIKIDLFPGRKDKRNGKAKTENKAEQPRTTTPPRNNATQQAGPKSTVKEAKSMQNISRPEQTEPRYQRPNTSRSYNSFSTGRPSTERSAHANGHDSQRPGLENPPQDDDNGTYQAPWSSTRHAEQDANRGAFHQQRPSTGDSAEYREPHERQPTTRDTTNSSDDFERPTGDQRRSRADLQDEWMADQRLRTNIPKGAPHSTSHALKHKRSKADMIRATENMARTLSRSPHRSPAANRRQLGSVDEKRPGTSSSNGSSRLHTHPKGHQHTSSLSNAESSNSCQPTTQRSNSAMSTDRDPLSPTKVSGVSKKQGKAFNSTIQVSPPLAMEPNKTTWSPTSSVHRKNDKTSTRQESKSAKNHGTQPDHSGAHARSKDSSTDSGRAERSKRESSAGSQMSASNGNSGQGERNPNQRNSIDNKKSDHLSLAQREAYASSHQADAQIPPVINRSNGAWNTHSRDTSGSSARSRSRTNEVQSKTVAINNGYNISSGNVQEENSKSAQQTNRDKTGTTISSGISYMNYSRPTASDSDPTTRKADANGNDETSSGVAGVSSQVVDFADRAAKPSASTKQQGKKSTKSQPSNSQAPKSKYVDAASSTTSPFQSKFNKGTSDPRTGHSRKASKNKFSSSTVAEKAHMSNASTTTAPSSKQKKAAPPSLPIAAHNQPRDANTQGNGRAKVVTINNGGASAIVATPMDSAFTHDRFEDRKDSGQSESMDFGGKTTYSNQKEGNVHVAVSGS